MMKRVAFVVLLVAVMTGCGRYKAPLPPEMFAPKNVDELSVTGTAGGVVLSWAAPDEDRRGKELKFIDGYAIQRKVIAHRGDETDPHVSFETIGFVKDRHVQIREDLRKAARAEGKIGRTIEAPKENMEFSYTDTSAIPSTTYIYQVVPQNQGGVDGGVKQFARVIFKGAASEVTLTKSDDSDVADDDKARRDALS
jgi:hypothetical protein